MSNYILHVEESLLRSGELFFFYLTKEGAKKEEEHLEELKRMRREKGMWANWVKTHKNRGIDAI